MRFDYAKGQPAKYIVNVYRWNSSDQYYVHYYREAKHLLESLKKQEAEGTTISVYDLKNDIRKDYARILK